MKLSPTGLFLSSTGNVSDKYDMEITPAGWTFSIWGAIYIAQTVFMLYSLIILCLKTPDGSPVYNNPAFLSPIMYIFYAINLAGNVAWLFVWDREYLTVALGLLLLVTFALYVCIGITMFTLNKHADEMVKGGMKTHITCTIVIVLNGLGLYAAWVSIASLINIVVVLHYTLEIVSQTVASTIFLGCLAFDAVVYACLDLVMFERHFRYVFTPYIVLHMALAGILYKNWDLSGNPEKTVFEIALICCGTFLVILKVINAVARSCKYTLYKHKG